MLQWLQDDDFIRLALWGRKLGRKVIITLEKPGELERVLRISQEMGVEPLLGVRFKVHARGTGQWESSGGDDAKFGLTAAELVAVVERVKREGLAHALKLLHCHVGSQLTDIRRIRVAVREAAQAYVELAEMGVGVQYLDVGGGLAVDYDGSKTTYYVSANYTCASTPTPWSTPSWRRVRSGGAGARHRHRVGPRANSAPLGAGGAGGRRHRSMRRPVDLPPLAGEEHALVRGCASWEGITVKTYREVYNEAVSNKGDHAFALRPRLPEPPGARPHRAGLQPHTGARGGWWSSSITCPTSSSSCPACWPTSTW